jgi:hypothetical protein
MLFNGTGPKASSPVNYIGSEFRAGPIHRDRHEAADNLKGKDS